MDIFSKENAWIFFLWVPPVKENPLQKLVYAANCSVHTVFFSFFLEKDDPGLWGRVFL